MHRILSKDQILTIPNVLSIFRMLMIPVIIWLYCFEQEYAAAVGVMILSGLTDIADGFIARKCSMVSDLGKILDPFADKMTQAAVVICLTCQYERMTVILILLVIKEICMGIIGAVAIKRTDTVYCAKWYGKVNTVILYLVMMMLIFFQGIPDVIANMLITVCGCSIIISFALYVRFYWKIICKCR